MFNLTIMVGIPSSGKTTYIKNNIKDKYIVSADKIRKQIHGMEFYKPAEQLVWTIRKYILINALEQGIDIVVDETSYTVDKRVEILRFAKEYKYIVDCVWMDTPYGICKERCKSEDKQGLIKKMNRNFEVPREEEGFIIVNRIQHK